MTTTTPSLLEVIDAIKALYSPEDAENLSIAYAGIKVEFEGEVWYEITTADSMSYTAFTTILEGELVTYDGDRISLDAQIPEIEAIYKAREEA